MTGLISRGWYQTTGALTTRSMVLSLRSLASLRETRFGIRDLAPTAELMDISTRDYDPYYCQPKNALIASLTLMGFCCCGRHFQRNLASCITERGHLHSLPQPRSSREPLSNEHTRKDEHRVRRLSRRRFIANGKTQSSRRTFRRQARYRGDSRDVRQVSQPAARIFQEQQARRRSPKRSEARLC